MENNPRNNNNNQKDNNIPIRNRPSNKSTTSLFEKISVEGGEFAVRIFFKLVNLFLNKINDSLQSIIPDPALGNVKQRSQILLNNINNILENPEFQAEIRSLSNNIINILRPLLLELNDLLENEGDVLAQSGYRVGRRVFRNLTDGVMDGVEAGISIYPVVGTLLDLLNVIQGVIDSASVIGVEFMLSWTKFMEAFLKVFGDTAGPLVDAIKTIQKILDMIRNMQSEASQFKSNITNKINTGINQALTPRSLPSSNAITRQQGGSGVGVGNKNKKIKSSKPSKPSKSPKPSKSSKPQKNKTKHKLVSSKASSKRKTRKLH